MRLLAFSSFLICATALTAACGSASTRGSEGDDVRASAEDQSAEAAQLNDVATLFPLAASASDLADGYLRASSRGERGVLLPQALYDAVGQMTGSSGHPPPGGAGVAEYGDLRVVAMRMDPCFAALAPSPHGDGCKNQLRLIVQELGEGPHGAFDSAAHLFYELSRDELTSLLKSIIALRVASSAPGERLGALAPHPIIAREGVRGPLATGLKSLILAYAGASNLTRITTMSSSNGGSSWTFAGFDVSDAMTGTMTPMQIPTLADDDFGPAQTFFGVFGDQMDGSVDRPTSSADDFMAFTNTTALNALSPDARNAAYGALLRVENPSKNAPDTIDCVSCHVATPTAKLVAEPRFQLSAAGNPNAFVPDGRFVRDSEMKPSFEAARGLNVHAFSYDGASPGISQRTVNEAAAVVAYVNANVLSVR